MAAAQPTYGPRYWDKCAWDRPTGWEEDSPIKKSQMTGAEQDAWYEAWSDRLREWWVATPYRDGISACFGAFGIHLSSRLGAAYKAWLAILGQQTPPNTMAGGMQTNTQNAENCDWIGDAATKLDLPDFPDFPAKFELPPVVPIPRLLPNLENLQSYLHQHQRIHGVTATSAQEETVGWVPAMGAGAAGALLAMGAVFFFYRGSRAASGNARISMRRAAKMAETPGGTPVMGKAVELKEAAATMTA